MASGSMEIQQYSRTQGILESSIIIGEKKSIEVPIGKANATPPFIKL